MFHQHIFESFDTSSLFALLFPFYVNFYLKPGIVISWFTITFTSSALLYILLKKIRVVESFYFEPDDSVTCAERFRFMRWSRLYYHGAVSFTDAWYFTYIYNTRPPSAFMLKKRYASVLYYTPSFLRSAFNLMIYEYIGGSDRPPSRRRFLFLYSIQPVNAIARPMPIRPLP